jgi:2-polyprenyl-6-methoxyphenol hydroxylase-like FAD-dependent oxidoreductase
MHTKKVLVVGGGIGGQSVAIAFRQAGVEVEIAEIQAEYNVYGVGIIQQANAIRALDAIGVADEAMRRGHPYGLVKMCLPHGVVIGEAGTPPIGRFPSHNGISRRILHDVLLERANEVGVKFSMNTTVDALEEETDGVMVTFNDGRKEKYDIVIGADGIRSKVREMVFGEVPINYVGLSVWRYPFKRPKDLDTGYMYFGKKSKIGLIPMTAETIYMFVVTAEGDDNPMLAEDSFIPKLKEYLSEYPVPMVQECVEQLTDSKLVNYRPMEVAKLPAPWHKGRVVIIGDAAHATIPQLGSGAALAIEDAVVLVEELQKENDVTKAFENFMARRLQRCMMVVEASETLGRWEYMQFHGQALPEGANPGMLMGKTCGALTAPI